MSSERSSLAAILKGALSTFLLLARAAHAQSVGGTIDVGGLALRYADTLSATAAAITPHVAADWGRGIADASGTFSQFTTRGWSAQGALSASLLTPAATGMLTELGGFAGGSARKDGTRTGEMLANGRLHLMRSGGEAFVGVGAGRTWDGIEWRSMILGEVGGSVSSENKGAVLTLSPILINDSISYTDTQLSLSLTQERLEFGVLLGARFGDRVTNIGTSARSWGSFSVVAWTTPRVGIVATGGTYPIDPTQGFPGGRFISLSLRLATRRPLSPQPVPAQQPVSATEASTTEGVVSGFAAERTAPGVVTIRVNLERARVVEISGDFTNWVPVQMQRSPNGWWSTALPISPGKYQMNVRVDGGKWLVPAGLFSIADEFGGRVGLLIIE